MFSDFLGMTGVLRRIRRAAKRGVPRTPAGLQLQTKRLQGLGVLADLPDLGFRRRNESLLGEVSLLTQGLLTRVLGNELVDAGDHTDVRLLHIDEERTRRGVLARRDGFKRGRDSINHRTLELVEIFLEEAVAEDSDRGWIGGQLLHDQVVVLAGLDVPAVLAHGVAGALEARLVLGT